MSDFYVYAHKRKTDGSIFYVGKGSNNRAWMTQGRSSAWRKTVVEHGYVVEIVMDKLEEDFALMFERMLISALGGLVNGNKGGGGKKSQYDRVYLHWEDEVWWINIPR